MENEVTPITKPNEITNTNENLHNRLKKRIDPGYSYIFMINIIRHVLKTLLGCFFLNKCTNNANASNGFKHAIIHITEGILCTHIPFMNLVAQSPHNNRHERQRNQGG